MSDEVRYDLVDFEGSIQNSSNIESNIDELAKSISNFRSSLDPRINEYYSDLKRLDYCKNDLSNDVSNVNNFSKWLQDGYHEYEEVAHQTEAMADGVSGSSSGSSGFSGSSGGVGGFASTAAELTPLSSTELNGVKGNGISDIKSTNPFISTDMEKFKTDSSAAKAVEGLSNTSKSSNYGTGVGLSGSTGAAAIGAGLGAATAGFGTSSTGSSENLSGQTYNGRSYGFNTSAHGELNHILGKEDDEDDDKKKDDVDISTNIAKDAKDKVDKIISKTKKVIPNLHTTSVGDSSGTGTSVAGGVTAGLGGLGAIGAVGGGLAYANNKMNTEEDEDDEDDENEDDEELGDYDKKDKDKSNEKDESSNKEWLYGLGIGLGAAGMAKKIKDDKDKDHDENKNSNQ